MIFFKVVKQPSSLPNHHKKTSPGVKVFGMFFQVFSEFPNSSSKNCYLDFWRTGVLIVSFKLFYYFSLFFFS